MATIPTDAISDVECVVRIKKAKIPTFEFVDLPGQSARVWGCGSKWWQWAIVGTELLNANNTLAKFCRLFTLSSRAGLRAYPLHMASKTEGLVRKYLQAPSTLVRVCVCVCAWRASTVMHGNPPASP